MSLFSLIDSLQKMADDPELTKSAASMGKAMQDIPATLASILGEMRTHTKLFVAMEIRLVEISLGLDTLSDPIKRPPFRADDVEAAMSGSWPPANVTEWVGDKTKGPIDYTDKTTYEGPDGQGT